MGLLQTYKIDDTIVKDFTTHNPVTGAVSDADVTPTCEVFEDANDTEILTPTCVKRTAKTGNYRVSIDLTGSTAFPKYFISSSKPSSMSGKPPFSQRPRRRSRWAWLVLVPVGFWKLGTV